MDNEYSGQTDDLSLLVKYSHNVGYLMSLLSGSCCTVGAYVREDNPRALASGLSPVLAHNHKIPYCISMHVHLVH